MFKNARMPFKKIKKKETSIAVTVGREISRISDHIGYHESGF